MHFDEDLFSICVTELSHERNITSASLTSDKTPPEEHIEINDTTSSSCNQQTNPTTSIQTTPKIAGLLYVRFLFILPSVSS